MAMPSIRHAAAIFAAITTCLAVFATGGGPIVAQEASRRFEVVSLRRIPPACEAFELSLRCEREPQAQVSWRMFPGGRLEFANQLAIDLIRVAYGIERLPAGFAAGGPGWLRSERYELIALTGSDGLPVDQTVLDLTQDMRMMLRTLLAERFKLRVRIEPKEQKVLLLRQVVPNQLGPQIRLTRGECGPLPTGSTRLRFSACVFLADGQIHAFNVTIADLLPLFEVVAPLPLRDGTGLSGRYDARFSQASRTSPHLAREVGLELVPSTNVIDSVKVEGAERPVDD